MSWDLSNLCCGRQGKAASYSFMRLQKCMLKLESWTRCFCIFTLQLFTDITNADYSITRITVGESSLKTTCAEAKLMRPLSIRSLSLLKRQIYGRRTTCTIRHRSTYSNKLLVLISTLNIEQNLIRKRVHLSLSSEAFLINGNYHFV